MKSGKAEHARTWALTTGLTYPIPKLGEQKSVTSRKPHLECATDRSWPNCRKQGRHASRRTKARAHVSEPVNQ